MGPSLRTEPSESEHTQGRSNARLAVGLGVFILAVFALTLWKFRPF